MYIFLEITFSESYETGFYSIISFTVLTRKKVLSVPLTKSETKMLLKSFQIHQDNIEMG